MRNDGCDHVGHYVYSRKTFENGSAHFCAQCTVCGRPIKLPRHDNRVWIKQSDVPATETIYSFYKVLQNVKNKS